MPLRMDLHGKFDGSGFSKRGIAVLIRRRREEREERGNVDDSGWEDTSDDDSNFPSPPSSPSHCQFTFIFEF